MWKKLETAVFLFEELNGLKVQCSKRVSLCCVFFLNLYMTWLIKAKFEEVWIWWFETNNLCCFHQPPFVACRQEGNLHKVGPKRKMTLRMMRRKGSVGCSEGFSDKLEHGWQAIAGEVLLWLCKRCKKQRKHRVYIGLPSNLKWLDLKSGFVSESNIDLCYIYYI